MDHLEVIFVGDLSYFCARQDLLDLFSQFGPVSSAVVRKSKSNEPLHYGFVELPSSCARKAVEVLQGTYFLGRKMRYVDEKLAYELTSAHGCPMPQSEHRERQQS